MTRFMMLATICVVANDYQLFTDSQGRRRPGRTYARDRYFGGYSDHLPVACVIEH